MEERRRHQRYGSSGERNFVVQYENKNSVIGRVKDFSRSGMSFNSQEDLNKVEELKLDLQMAGIDQKVSASIQILWSENNPDGRIYGARFTNISPHFKFDIMDLLYQDWRKNLNSDSLLS